MKLKERRVGQALVVDVEGKLTGGPDSGEFHGLFKRLLGEGERRLVVNLEKTPWATSQGIGLLIGALTSVTNAGGRLVLAGACGRVHEVLRVTRLILIFETFCTVEEAARHLLAEEPGDAAAARVASSRAIAPG